MKKMMCGSGLLAVLFFVLLLTGRGSFANDEAEECLRLGNELYAWGLYAEALAYYEQGLALSPENEILSFNAGQSANHLGEYVLALLHYENAGNRKERFLNAGRVNFRIADHDNLDQNMKMRYYSQALQLYKDGIILYPQDIDLKYNYEFLQRLMQEEANSENPEQTDSEQQEAEEREANEEQGEQPQNQSSDEQEQTPQNADADNSENSAQEQEQSSGEENRDDAEQQDGQNSSAAQQEDQDEDRESIERLLQLLESEEEETLKNNQGVVEGVEGKYGW